jgi:hypothetical protein
VSEIVQLVMNSIVDLAVILLVVGIVSYISGWLFCAGYQQRKHQDTKRLIQLLREGNSRDESHSTRV